MPSGVRAPLIAALVGALALSAAAVGLAAPPRPDPGEPLVLAVESPQSGDQASSGLDQLSLNPSHLAARYVRIARLIRVQLAVRQVNPHGGVLGRRVTIHRADDKGDRANAKAVARRVIAAGIRFVIGPYNSSVGIENLQLYRRSGVLPLWNTSRDDTGDAGATVQPMNSQIAPVESRHVARIGATRVTMLVDDRPRPT